MQDLSGPPPPMGGGVLLCGQHRPALRIIAAASLRLYYALGRLAQLGERLVYTQKVGGSIPSAPTIS